MSKCPELLGKQFGRLTVVAKLGKRGHNRMFWLCKCACGVNREIHTGSLTEGTRSCGCLQREATSVNSRTHGASKTGTYKSWNAMRHRCKNTNLRNYGAKGISYCERWESYENFLADMGRRPIGMWLERIDNNIGYNADNCKWATPGEQGLNRCNNYLITYNGKTQPLAAWSREIGVNRASISARLHRGLSIPEAFAKSKPRKPSMRLTDSEAEDLRAQALAGTSGRTLALRFNISPSYVSRLITGKYRIGDA